MRFNWWKDQLAKPKTRSHPMRLRSLSWTCHGFAGASSRCSKSWRHSSKFVAFHWSLPSGSRDSTPRLILAKNRGMIFCVPILRSPCSLSWQLYIEQLRSIPCVWLCWRAYRTPRKQNSTLWQIHPRLLLFAKEKENNSTRGGETEKLWLFCSLHGLTKPHNINLNRRYD